MDVVGMRVASKRGEADECERSGSEIYMPHLVDGVTGESDGNSGATSGVRGLGIFLLLLWEGEG
jgi:hypothetical protein